MPQSFCSRLTWCLLLMQSIAEFQPAAFSSGVWRTRTLQ